MLHELMTRLADTFDPGTIEAVKGPVSLYGGLILGLIFGVVLQKGKICKYDVVSGLFRLQDFTVFRLGVPLLIVSMVLIYFLKGMGIMELHIPKTVIVPQIIGGLMFGSAIAILGYCPGTAAGALGEGSLDAIPSVLGMIVGAVIYAEFFHVDWSNTFLTWGTLSRGSFAEILRINPWYLIVLFILMATMFLMMVTMFDWFLIFLKKTLNRFHDLTDTLDEKRPTAPENISEDTKAISASTRNTVSKLKKNLNDIFKSPSK
ncbi:MAG: YeeE/YedE family protein [Nitrospirae bacterium]|nr:YeeE/YedE family protein [Nitrospirota bacterium]